MRSNRPHPILVLTVAALVATILILTGCAAREPDPEAPTTTVSQSTARTVPTTLSPTPSATQTTKRLPGWMTRRETTTTARPPTTGDPLLIARKLRPSVVGVTAIISETAREIRESVGSGVIFTNDGLIITSNHVVVDDAGHPAERVTVTLSSGSELRARIVGRDKATDLALLRVETNSLQPAIFRTDFSDLLRGDLVVAMGNARVLADPVTSGTFTSIIDGEALQGLAGVDRLLETTAPLARGNSGGPLADNQARVIGINVAELLDPRSREAEGGLAIPADLAVRVAEELLAGQ